MFLHLIINIYNINYMYYVLCLFSLIMLGSSSMKLFQIEKRFDQHFQNFSTLALPVISEEQTLDQELNSFTQIHQKQQFKNFVADPELSAQILLKKQNSWNQSIYLVGKEASYLLIEITVTHKLNQHKFDNQSLEIYLINCETNEIVFFGKVKHLKLIQKQVFSELYELRIGFNWKKGDKQFSKQQEQIEKHVRVSMDIIPIGMKVEEAANKNQDQIKTLQKLRIIKNESDRIFINSLDIWEQVQVHHTQHFQNQQKVYLRTYFELIAVFIINIIQICMLRKALKIKSLV